jgi:hypothetical protein
MCSITNAADEWELAEAVEMVRDGTAKQQLKGMQLITAALKGVPVHPVEVPPLPSSEIEAFDSVRRIWAKTFDDLAKEDGDPGAIPGAASPDSEEGVISDLLSFGEVPPPPTADPAPSATSSTSNLHVCISSQESCSCPYFKPHVKNNLKPQSPNPKPNVGAH